MMIITVACKGRLTLVGVTVFNILSGFLGDVFDIGGPDACLQHNSDEDLQAQELQVARK